MITREKNIEVEVEGLKIGMRLDNWALKEAQKKSGCKGMVELFNRISDADIDALIVTMMEGMNEYNYYFKKNENFDERYISECIDKIGGASELVKIITDGIKQFQSPNQEAPEKAGESSQ